ncbi:hypothetical protein NQ318_001695 [Aromia moschata]|uniref:RNA-directed DNA polymerase n=1 Tax=Aromia moschata TaxID=1265417 RepID=A0AAV8Y682_9CUCU|nr:hypothetical protein NQ318_001695 [Aromia moschata]
MNYQFDRQRNSTMFQKLAFDFAQANNIPNNFNKDSKMASKKWIYGFLHRHKNISLRKPEATSYARATGFNRAVGEAFGKASNVQTAVNGFRKTGIWPFNSEIFQEWEFAPSRTTERGENSENVDPAGETEVPAILPLNIKPTATRTTPLRSTTPTSTPSTSREQNSCSSSVQEIREKNDSDEDQPLSTYVAKRKLEIISESHSSSKIRITDISPLPMAKEKQKKTSSRKSLQSTILTESPYKNKLEDLEASKSPKNAKGVKRAIVVEGKSKQEIQSSKKTNIIDHGTGASELDDTNCIVCGESYMDTKEDWYNCHGCSEWAHESCGTMDEFWVHQELNRFNLEGESGLNRNLPQCTGPKAILHSTVCIWGTRYLKPSTVLELTIGPETQNLKNNQLHSSEAIKFTIIKTKNKEACLAGFDWVIYKRRLDNYFLVNSITDDNKKRAILLNALDEEPYKLIYNLSLPRLPEEKTYKELTEIFNKHYKVVETPFVARAKFFAAFKNHHENVNEWAARIRSLALNYAIEVALPETAATETQDFREVQIKMEPGVHHVTSSGKQRHTSTPSTSSAQISKTGDRGKCACCSRKNHPTKMCRFREFVCNVCNVCNVKGHLDPMCPKKKDNKPNTGLDILSKHGFVVDVKNIIIQIQNEEIVMAPKLQDYSQSRRIIVEEDIQIPQGSEKIVIAKLDGNGEGLSTGIVEASERNDGLLVARSLVQMNNQIPVEDEWSSEELKKSQKKDSDLKLIRNWVKNGVRPTWQEISRYGTTINGYWAQWNSLRFRDGLLDRNWESLDGVSAVYQLFLPKARIHQVLEELHSSLTGGHFGVNRTLARVRNRFYWVNCRRDVEEWCKKCDLCSAKKGPNTRSHGKIVQYLSGAPFERLAVDIFGPLPVTDRGNKYLMVVMDYF